jgi:hypothetical protein
MVKTKSNRIKRVIIIIENKHRGRNSWKEQIYTYFFVRDEMMNFRINLIETAYVLIFKCHILKECLKIDSLKSDLLLLGSVVYFIIV